MATATNRRSWMRPRFSLRVLLLAFTAFAIGFPVWYRWPYEEREYPWQTDLSKVEHITNWQRQWGGGRLQHGEERWEIDGVPFSLFTYKDGHKHGPYFDYGVVNEVDSRGVRLVRSPHPVKYGQYADDLKIGGWVDAVLGEPQFYVYPLPDAPARP